MGYFDNGREPAAANASPSSGKSGPYDGKKGLEIGEISAEEIGFDGNVSLQQSSASRALRVDGQASDDAESEAARWPAKGVETPMVQRCAKGSGFALRQALPVGGVGSSRVRERQGAPEVRQRRASRDSQRLQ